MLLTMAVSLFTSRVVLATLGVEDYGIYNVVGGVVAMFSFLTGTMSSSTQRYITFTLGKGNQEKLVTVFSTAIQIHALISIAIVILAETVGLWFLNEKLVIPDTRMSASFWVYQCSILAAIISVMSVPYNASIIAHEKMSAFAYISIIEVLLKLGIVYILIISPWDKLIVYAILILIVQLFIRSIYARYCSRHFEETKYHHSIDKPLLKEMLSFAGWSFWGNFAAVLYGQGVNMLLNIFFGPVVNAARGVSIQVQNAVRNFVTNFQMALNPQITKNYAQNNLDQMHDLMFKSARFSFFLLFFLSLPIFIETNFILNIWLKNVPENSATFTQIMIATSLIYTTANPLVIANQATGKVKVYQAVVGGILLLILPISYITLRLGAPVYSVFIVQFCVEIIAQFARMIMLRKLIDLPVSRYFYNIYFQISIVVAISIILPLIVRTQFTEGWLRFIVVSFSCVLSVITTVFFVGLTKVERNFFTKKVLQILRISK